MATVALGKLARDHTRDRIITELEARAKDPDEGISANANRWLRILNAGWASLGATSALSASESRS